MLFNLMESYSSIISPEDYNDLMNNQHLYIGDSDTYLINILTNMSQLKHLEVVELGCGPIRFARKLAKIPNINLTAVDIDKNFVSYGKQAALDEKLKINIINDNILHYKHNKPIDIVCTHGLHHHIFKGKNCNNYLLNIYNQLSEDGYYFLIDEFIADYKNEYERNIKIIIWYSHIIADAESNQYYYLAREEAKTLLDDLQEGSNDSNQPKTAEQLALVISYAPVINSYAVNNCMQEAQSAAEELLIKLGQPTVSSPEDNENSMRLSRRDYKICDKVFREEISSIGFLIEDRVSFGPIDSIGGLSIYKIKK